MEGHTKPGSSDLYPVEAYARGDGPPYAPPEWPEIGDVWRWSVGTRVKKCGTHQNRYLFPPMCYPNTYGSRNYITSKDNLERYFKGMFPTHDFDEFMASFSWDIPAKRLRNQEEIKKEAEPEVKDRKRRTPKDNPCKLETAEASTAAGPRQKKKRKGEVLRKERQAKPESKKSARLRTLPRAKKYPCLIDLSDLSDSSSDFSPAKDNTDWTSYEDGLMYCVEVENPNLAMVLYDPLVLTTTAAAKDKNENAEVKVAGKNEATPAWQRLASLLERNVISLMAGGNLDEVKDAVAAIREADPSISIDNLLKLHMVEKIPLLGMSVSAEEEELLSDSYCVELTKNVAKIIPMISAYNESKAKAIQETAEIKANLELKERVENKIAKLIAKRERIDNSTALKKKVRAASIATRKTIGTSIPKLLESIEIGSTTRSKLEIQKAEAAKEINEIIAKYNRSM